MSGELPLGQDQSRKYVVLDGLRGVAALAIVVLHSDRYFGDYGLPSAGIAVDLFFCLSGFVLAYAYEDRFDRGMTPFQFMKLRFIRLYPLYLLGILLGVAYAVAAANFPQYGKEISWSDFLVSLPFNLVMLPTPVTNALFPLNGVMWSIFFELVANLIWVLFHDRLRPMRVLVGVVLLSGIAFIVAALHAGSIGLGLEKTTFLGGLARVGYSFFLGVLLYRLRDVLAVPKVADWLIVAVLVTLFALPRWLPMELASIIMLLPGLVLLGAATTPSPALASLWHHIGTASYAVYCVHKRGYVLSYAALLHFFGFDARSFAPFAGLVYLAVLVIACLVLDRIYDRPARDMLLSWFARRRGVQAS